MTLHSRHTPRPHESKFRDPYLDEPQRQRKLKAEEEVATIELNLVPTKTGGTKSCQQRFLACASI
jgi:hypothetical protein